MEKQIDLKVVDVLPENFYRKEHIAGAISLPVGKIAKLAEQKLHKSDHIAVYCLDRTSPASTQAALTLEAMGYKHIYDYKGGIEDYKQAGLPLDGGDHAESSNLFLP